MTLKLTKNERTAVTHALQHAYRKGELIRRVGETDYDFSAGQLDEIQGALAQEALVSAGMLCGDAYNREALAGGAALNAMLQRLQSMGR